MGIDAEPKSNSAAPTTASWLRRADSLLKVWSKRAITCRPSTGSSGAASLLARQEALFLHLFGGRIDDLVHERVQLLRVGRLAHAAPEQLVMRYRIKDRLDRDHGVRLQVAGVRGGGPSVAPVSVERSVIRTSGGRGGHLLFAIDDAHDDRPIHLLVLQNSPQFCLVLQNLVRN